MTKTPFTYRINESVREGTQVKHRTLLNLGKDFAIEPASHSWNCHQMGETRGIEMYFQYQQLIKNGLFKWLI